MPISRDEFDSRTDTSVKDANRVKEFLQTHDEKAFTFSELSKRVELEGEVTNAVAKLQLSDGLRTKKVDGQTYLMWG